MPEVKEKVSHESEVLSHEQETRIEQRKQAEIIQDVKERHEVPKEIKTWMEKIEQDPAQQKSVSDDNGQPLLTPSTPTDTKVQLPTNRNTFIQGFKDKFDEAGRWLSAFVLRLIKKNKGNVKFREE